MSRRKSYKTFNRDSNVKEETMQEENIEQVEEEVTEEEIQAVAEETIEEINQEEEQVETQEEPKEEAVYKSGTVIADTSMNEAPAQVEKPKAAPVAITEPTKPVGTAQQMLQDLLENSQTPAVRGFASTLINYMDALAPGKGVSNEVGARNQSMFWRSIQSLVNGGGKEFNKGWSTFLNVIHAERQGIFSERYMFRFMEHVSMSKNDYSAFTAVLNLAHVTSDPKGRQVALKQVDIGKTLAQGFTDEGKQNLLNFYGL